VLFAGSVAIIGAGLAGLLWPSPTDSASRTYAVAGLDVLPFPGTPDASPQSLITFPALSPSDFESVSVRGSSSGVHAGQLSELPRRRGTTFTPRRAFAAGERVIVNALLGSVAAANACGDPDSTRLKFSFTVARGAPVVPDAGPPAEGITGSATGRPAKAPPTQSFVSEPSLRPPVVSVSQRDHDPSAGEIFVDAQDAPENGPMIFNSNGQLVWFAPLPGNQTAFGPRVQTYRGRPVLTYWQGNLVAGHGQGVDLIVNHAYQTVATVRGAEGYAADLHEFQLTPAGTALITAYRAIHTDLSSIGGSRNGSVYDGVIQEIDVATGKLLWEWHALGHVPLSDAEAGPPTPEVPYDFFHVNSIQQLPNGNLIVSARNTWTVYEIDHRTGAIVWQLGGKNSSFRMGPNTQFEWQHDAQVQPRGTLTLFDDAADEESESRGLQLRLNTETMRATVGRSYTHDPPLRTDSQGNAQVLPNGNVFIGWGAEPNFSEHTVAGKQIFSARFGGTIRSYRAYRSPWHAKPSTRPAIATRRSAATGALTVYTSWNGATDVARWRVLGGPSVTSLSTVAQRRSRGFETAIPLSGSPSKVAVQALTSSGRVLSSSFIVTP
jgi:hypothetical protein